MHAVLVGNYGVGNFGDEALQHYFLHTFPEIDWTVVSASPTEKQVPRLPSGLRSFFCTPWWRTLQAYAHTDSVVLGGGTLLTDVESSFACVLWSLHILLARLLRKPVLLAFQGVGPFRTRRGEWIARKSLAAASFVSVRDAQSLARVQSWNLNSKIVQSFDPIYKEIYARKPDRTQNILILIPRANSSDSFQKSAIAAAQKQEWSGVRILSFAPHNVQESSYCKQLSTYISGATICPILSLDGLITNLNGAGYVLTERFHGAIAAHALGIPFAVMSQGEGDKLSAMGSLDQSSSDTNAILHLITQGEDALSAALR